MFRTASNSWRYSFQEDKWLKKIQHYKLFINCNLKYHKCKTTMALLCTNVHPPICEFFMTQKFFYKSGFDHKFGTRTISLYRSPIVSRSSLGLGSIFRMPGLQPGTSRLCMLMRVRLPSALHPR